MKEPNTLIIIVSVLFSAFTGVIVYLWKQKDKQGERFSDKLDEILEGVTNNSKETAEIKKDTHTLLNEVSALRKKEEILRSDVATNDSRISTLMEFKKNQERLNEDFKNK